MSKFFLYGIADGVERTMQAIEKDPVTYKSLKDVFAHFENHPMLKVFKYSHSSRLNHDVYMITKDGCFESFMIDLEEEESE